MNGLIEIAVYGRGGQGAVTAAELLAKAAFRNGRYSQAFPSFGVERRGAPVSAFCRISDEKITLKSQVYYPNYALVLDSTLLPMVDLDAIAKKKGAVIVNTSQNIPLGRKGGIKFFKADISSIAREIFGADIVNTAIVAAFSAFTKEVSIEAVEESLPEIFSDEKMLEKNRTAVRKAYELCVGMIKK